MTKITISWKLYFILLTAGIISIIASLPYAFTLAGDTLKQVTIPLPILIAISVVQSSVFFAIALFLGLKLSKKIGLGLPIIEDYLLNKDMQSDVKSIFKTSLFIGIATGITIILLDLIFYRSGVQISLWAAQLPPFWMRFLVSFYGGFGEEILLRLFFMSFLVWLLSRFNRSDQNIVNNGYVMWVSIIIAALLFGLGHLPITARVTALTPLVLVRAILLNGIGGIGFGWLYWKKGLESAMIAHFTADMVLHAIFPLLLSITKGTI
jgi:membrane protease YdiL (CAAX protease family)